MMAVSEDRVRSVDWLRGIAVIVMIQCHALVLLRPDLRLGPWLPRVLKVDGLSAPTFFLAAGFAMALLQVRAARKAGQATRFARQLKRVGEVLVAATLVNLMWFPIFREPRWLVRIDILHSIGLSLLVGLVTMTPLARWPRVLRGTAIALALTTVALTPFAEDVTGPFASLLNKSTGSAFTMVPWVGYVWIGAYLGAVTAQEGSRGFRKGLVFWGVLGLVIVNLADVIRPLYPPFRFVSSHPSNAAIRWVWLCGALLVLSVLERRVSATPARFGPRRVLEIFGTSSLSAYVIHEALLYGKLGGFSFEQLWGRSASWGFYALLTVLLVTITFFLCIAYDRAKDAVKSFRAGRTVRA